MEIPQRKSPRLVNLGKFLTFVTWVVSATSLVHPSASAEVSLVTDASSSHVGAALQQRESGCWKPLAFFSAKLSATQQRYSDFDRELLGVFLALRHFQFELEGRKFHVITDHLPLVSTLSRVSPPWSSCQQCQLAYISEFTSDIRHTSGAANVVADSLSRPPSSGISPPSPLPAPGAMVSKVSELLEVSEVTDIPEKISSLPSPFPASAVGINFSELAAEQLSCPNVLPLALILLAISVSKIQKKSKYCTQNFKINQNKILI